MSEQYWASEGPDKIASEIFKKVDTYQEFMKNSGILDELRNSYNKYYGITEIEDVDQSLKAIHINHYASYIRNIHNMVTSSRPAWEPRAINTDLETQADTQLAAGLLDYYMKEKGIEEKLIEAAEWSLFLREGWVSLDWNAQGGKAYGVNPETGEAIHEGDFECDSHIILDVIRNIRGKRIDDKGWKIVRRFKNKWDLAAKFPEHAKEITAITLDTKTQSEYELTGFLSGKLSDLSDPDLIPHYTLVHPKTPALPEGRIVEVVTKEFSLIDGPLPYKNIYLFPITAGKKSQTAFGHSYPMDLMPIQDAIDMCASAITTNIAANGVQNFQSPKGATPTVTQLQDGMNIVEYDPKAGKLEPLELLKTAPEVYTFMSTMVDHGDLISNVSQIGRGNAPAAMSGTAMALLQQQAIQSTSGLQTSYTMAMEDTGTGLIELLQTFAVVPRIAMIAGKAKRSMMREFTRENLQGIGRVFVDRANPLSKTGAGRMEIANQLLATGLITDAQQYFGVLTTGNLEPLYQRDNSQRMLILSENERLMEGQPVQALLTDNHPNHILEHSCVLDSPEARENPEIVQATLAHIQEHMNLGKTLDPAMAMLLKQTSIFQPPMPPPSTEGGPGIPQVMDNQNPVTEQAEQTQLPSPAQPPNPNAFQGGV